MLVIEASNAVSIKKLINNNPISLFKMSKEQESFLKDKFPCLKAEAQAMKDWFFYVRGENFILEKSKEEMALLIIVKKISTNFKQVALLGVSVRAFQNKEELTVLFPASEGERLLNGIVEAPDMFNPYDFLEKKELSIALDASLKSDTKKEKRIKV